MTPSALPVGTHNYLPNFENERAHKKKNHMYSNRPAHSACKIMHAVINFPLRLECCRLHGAENQIIIASGAAFIVLPHY